MGATLGQEVWSEGNRVVLAPDFMEYWDRYYVHTDNKSYLVFKDSNDLIYFHPLHPAIGHCKICGWEGPRRDTEDEAEDDVIEHEAKEHD